MRGEKREDNLKPAWVVIVIAWLFILIGAVGLLADAWPLLTPDAGRQLASLRAQGLVELGPAWGLRFLAIVGGVGLLRGFGWARWLLLLWMATHVGISLFDSLGKALAHLAIFLPVTFLLFLPFHRSRGTRREAVRLDRKS